MEQLTLEQAAEDYRKSIQHEPGNYYDHYTPYTGLNGFKAGAEWQKEQLRPLYEIAKFIIGERGPLSNDIIDKAAKAITIYE
jgi:hypothetical protein